MLDVKKLTLNELPDAYRHVRDIRLAMEKEVEAVKSVESAIKQRMIDEIPKDSAGVFGLKFKAQIVTKPSIRVSGDGWTQFYGFVRQSGRFDLLQKRINPAALLELANEAQSAGHVIPGTERFNEVDLSVTKV